MERLPRDKHSSLLRKSVNYDRKKFYSTGSTDRMYFRLLLQPERDRVRLDVRLHWRRLPHRRRGKNASDMYSPWLLVRRFTAFMALTLLSDFFIQRLAWWIRLLFHFWMGQFFVVEYAQFTGWIEQQKIRFQVYLN
jgi:hypothetical protein